MTAKSSAQRSPAITVERSVRGFGVGHYKAFHQVVFV
jgi:hypothetical protein